MELHKAKAALKDQHKNEARDESISLRLNLSAELIEQKRLYNDIIKNRNALETLKKEELNRDKILMRERNKLAQSPVTKLALYPLSVSTSSAHAKAHIPRTAAGGVVSSPIGNLYSPQIAGRLSIIDYETLIGNFSAQNDISSRH